jgi:hypothetical protein
MVMIMGMKMGMKIMGTIIACNKIVQAKSILFFGLNLFFSLNSN